MLPKYVDKICKMRIFEDENGKTNLSLADVGGELLIVSQQRCFYRDYDRKQDKGKMRCTQRED